MTLDLMNYGLISFFLILMIALSEAIIRSKDLVNVVLLMSGISLLSGFTMTLLNAVDVSITEVSVGAGLSSLLAFLTLTRLNTTKIKLNPIHPLALVVMLLGLISLMYAMTFVPLFGNPNESVKATTEQYVHFSHELHIPNVVTFILGSARGFDTMIETLVIFSASLGISALMKKNRKDSSSEILSPSFITRILAKSIIPLILMFALYVQFHGEHGPGGGFQAGVLMASGFVLFALIKGKNQFQALFSERFMLTMGIVGFLLYLGMGLITLGLGGAFLDYSVLSSNPAKAQKIGLLIIELGVGICVCFSCLLIFNSILYKNFR